MMQSVLQTATCLYFVNSTALICPTISPSLKLFPIKNSGNLSKFKLVFIYIFIS